MSDNKQDAFETAMADVFEGREVQLGHGPRKLLRAFYERAQTDARGGGSRATASSGSKIGQKVAQFQHLQVDDVFQNDHLRSLKRCRRVVQIIDRDTIETDYVDTDTGHVEKATNFHRFDFQNFRNYRYIADPA